MNQLADYLHNRWAYEHRIEAERARALEIQKNVEAIRARYGNTNR